MAVKLIYERIVFTVIENHAEIPEPSTWIQNLRGTLNRGENSVVDVMTTDGMLAFALTPETQFAMLVTSDSEIADL